MYNRGRYMQHIARNTSSTALMCVCVQEPRCFQPQSIPSHYSFKFGKMGLRLHPIPNQLITPRYTQLNLLIHIESEVVTPFVYILWSF